MTEADWADVIDGYAVLTRVLGSLGEAGKTDHDVVAVVVEGETKLRALQQFTLQALAAGNTVSKVRNQENPAQHWTGIRPSGAYGMHAGDRVYRTGNHWIRGVVTEFLQDGDACVQWDDGSSSMVKWAEINLLYT